MNPKSSKLSLYSLLILVFVSLVVYVVIDQNTKITASNESGNILTHSIPFKVGENEIKLRRNLDLSQRVIGLNGSLKTIEEAKSSGVIEGFYDLDGKELDKLHLLVAGSSFIIKVKDISSSPALFY